MIVELYPADGLTRGQPLRLNVSQVLVRQDNGTPILVAAECADRRAQEVSKIGDQDFEHLLKKLGVHMSVIVDELQLPAAPRGARLIHNPLAR